MKIAIDSYCYHRYFGEVYPGLEQKPEEAMSMLQFLDKAASFGAHGVSIESCFLSDPTDAEIKAIADRLVDLKLEVMWAWGHPGGLGSGAQPHQLHDLKKHTELASRVGAGVMRICCGGRQTRINDWKTHKEKLTPLLEEAVEHASRHGVVLAIENHIDFLADELVDLVETFRSDWLGVCLDTANNLRMLEDPMKAIEKLAPFAKATHIKDITAFKGDPRAFAFWPSVALGDGLIDIRQGFECLKSRGYDGLLALEIDYLIPGRYADEDEAVQRSIAYMKQTLAA
ncbi:sugar phosphate isomerase/epimerase family protein [Rhizobium leguminosarum]|uniref:sugar phosphate isomerase/epimerase family protein n=1 Tax=Rhizobium leguminosarum TaxID=384 RepID=UPI001C93A966|nr:sugar phosphate isomerase/epimerase [Rhizobium leguminosarum]MBY5406771.1 sugar phosphate isomerase/epimerase [Rhizobium leguminosarum]